MTDTVTATVAHKAKSANVTDANVTGAVSNAASLAAQLGGQLVGENRPVTALAPPDTLGDAPQSGSVVVLSAEEVRAFQSRDLGRVTQGLGALVVSEAVNEGLGAVTCPVIAVPDARLAFAQLTAIFAPPIPKATIAAKAVVHPDAVLGEGVSIGAGAVIGAGVRLGVGCRIGAGCVVGDGAVVGPDTLLHANVTLYPGVQLGARVILHSGVVVGGDGFGYAFGPQGALKIYHHGTVVLEDDVEVGANSCIDRGTLSETRIGARSKIDNLCQIGHNVVIGPDCVVAGASAVGGSTVLGRGVVLGGQVGVTDHVQLGDGVRVAGGSSVLKSVPAGETWAGYPARPHRRWVRELYLLGRLGAIWEHLKDEVRSEGAEPGKKRD